MRSTRILLVFVVLVLTGADVTAQPRPGPIVTGVRKTSERVAGCKIYDGVVDAIDADELVLIEKRVDNRTVMHRFVPIDLLREGEYIRERHDGANSYRWADVKKGDTVKLQVRNDDVDGLTYCLQISIRRRSGEKLPACQNPDKDRWYDANRVLNEIENRNDVSDEELLKTWPSTVNRKTGEAIPGGLWKTGWMAEYHEKLTDNRKRIAEEKVKKAAELKAKPVADKADPKKDDKK